MLEGDAEEAKTKAKAKKRGAGGRPATAGLKYKEQDVGRKEFNADKDDEARGIDFEWEVR